MFSQPPLPIGWEPNGLPCCLVCDSGMARFRTILIDIEHLSDEELQELADKYQKVREECDLRIWRRRGPT
jgi:hypothetical protein